MDAPTPASLLDRLHGGTPGTARRDAAWRDFVALYTPLLYRWARGSGLVEADAADFVQEVFVVLLRELPRFRYDANRSFRAWLRTVFRHKWAERARRPRLPSDAAADVADVADPGDGPSDSDYRAHLVRMALGRLRGEFTPATWQAFDEHVRLGRPVADVARDLGTTTNAVYVAKSRVLSRLRLELAGLLD